jgi:L-seryl-tRNA(Ser) seleniumtransferase
MLSDVVATRSPLPSIDRLLRAPRIGDPRRRRESQGDMLLPAHGPAWRLAVGPCRSQIGSGALPEDRLASAVVTVAGRGVESLASRLRALSLPVLGRLGEGRLWLDCRCLTDADERDLAAVLSGSGIGAM